MIYAIIILIIVAVVEFAYILLLRATVAHFHMKSEFLQAWQYVEHNDDM